MIRVVVGTEPSQYVAQKVLEHSIRCHTREPVEVRFETWHGPRVGGTHFGFVRFTVPKSCEYRGRAIYLDADQLVFADIAELERSLDDEHDVALVQEPEGVFNEKPVGRHNQTSVMVLACERLRDWDPERLFENVIPNRQPLAPGQIHYRDFMTASWVQPSRIQALDPAWNHFNLVNERTKLVHFSHVRSQPWKNPDHPLTDLWERWLRKALVDGALRRRELVREILRGHVHRRFLRILPWSRRTARLLDRVAR